MRLLYVEDNPVNALLFEEALRTEGWVALRVAADGEQALQVAREFRPDVLVLDSHLPDTSGSALLPRLRALPGLEHAPAVMCSADALPEEMARALACGFDAYWTKPVHIHAVLADLRRLAPQDAAGER